MVSFVVSVRKWLRAEKQDGKIDCRDQEVRKLKVNRQARDIAASVDWLRVSKIGDMLGWLKARHRPRYRILYLQ